MSKRNVKLAAMGLAVVMAAALAAPAFAKGTPTASGSGVSSDKQKYDSASGWSGSDSTYEGKIHLLYDTSNGGWQDPGEDPNSPDDNGNHDNGTYVVTIPTRISYENMNIGKVSTSDDYTVNVRGAIGDGQTVTLKAETGKTLKNGSKEEIKETTTQGKTTWSSDETYGGLNVDGSLKGTDTTDNIKMEGEVTTSGVYQGSVAYNASLS